MMTAYSLEKEQKIQRESPRIWGRWSSTIWNMIWISKLSLCTNQPSSSACYNNRKVNQTDLLFNLKTAMPKGLLAPSLIPGWVLPHEIETLDGIFWSSPGWCISCIICQRRYTSFDLIYCTYCTLCKYCSVLSPQYAAIEFNSSLGPENLCREFSII